MSSKQKAVVVWLATPYLFLAVVAIVVAVAQGSISSVLSFLALKSQVMILLFGFGSGVLGTLILWLLPIRREWLGMLTGLILALGFVVTGARIDMALWGGFEENVGIFLVAVGLAGPSCAAGAYAGLIRARDRDRGKQGDDDGWWPSPQS